MSFNTNSQPAADSVSVASPIPFGNAIALTCEYCGKSLNEPPGAVPKYAPGGLFFVNIPCTYHIKARF